MAQIFSEKLISLTLKVISFTQIFEILGNAHDFSNLSQGNHAQKTYQAIQRLFQVNLHLIME